MKKINKINCITFIIIFAITLIVFYNFISMHYATDTYNIINRGYTDYALKYSLNDGRPVMCLISLLADFINLPIETYIITLTVIALAISCVTVIKLKNIFINFCEDKNLKNEIILLIISYVTIFNFAYLENMYFAECAVMALSILLYTIAANIFANSEKYRYLKSIGLIILAVLCYQGTVSYFIGLVFVLTLIKNNGIDKKIFKDVFISGIIIVIGVLINLLQIKISGLFLDMTQSRMGSLANIFDNLQYICNNIINILINTFNLFPKYLLLIYFAVILGVSLIGKENQKKSINVLLIIILCIVVTYIPNLLTKAAFGTGRMAFSIGASAGLSLIYIWSTYKKNSSLKILIIIVAITYLIITIGNYVYIMSEHKKVNEQDKEESLEIGKLIKDYEETNKTEIKNICFLYDKEARIWHDNITCKTSICYRAIYPEWSRTGLINYYNNRNFIELENAKGKYYQVKEDEGQKVFNENELMFENDTVYIYVN